MVTLREWAQARFPIDRTPGSWNPACWSTRGTREKPKEFVAGRCGHRTVYGATWVDYGLYREVAVRRMVADHRGVR